MHIKNLKYILNFSLILGMAILWNGCATLDSTINEAATDKRLQEIIITEERDIDMYQKAVTMPATNAHIYQRNLKLHYNTLFSMNIILANISFYAMNNPEKSKVYLEEWSQKLLLSTRNTKDIINEKSNERFLTQDTTDIIAGIRHREAQAYHNKVLIYCNASDYKKAREIHKDYLQYMNNIDFLHSNSAELQEYLNVVNIAMQLSILQGSAYSDPLDVKIELEKLNLELQKLPVITKKNNSEYSCYEATISLLNDVRTQRISLQTFIFSAYPPTLSEFKNFAENHISFLKYHPELQVDGIKMFSVYSQLAMNAVILGFSDYATELYEIFKKGRNGIGENNSNIKYNYLWAINKARLDKNYTAGLKSLDELEAFYLANNLQNSMSKATKKQLKAELLEHVDHLAANKEINEVINHLENERLISKNKENFFSNRNAKYYHILIRNAYTLYDQSKSKTSFSNLITATEQLRARSFKEEHAGNIKFDLNATQSQLKADDAIVGYTDAGSYYLAYVITKDHYQAYKFDSIDQIKELVKTIKPNLEDPSSDRIALENNLQKLSSLIVIPLLDSIKNKSTIYLLTDSQLNFMPFELLSDTKDTYNPMLQSRSILLHPSIAYIKKSDNSSAIKNLLIIADPQFTSYKYQEMDINSLKKVTRNASIGNYFIPLPETLTEAKMITSYFPKEQSKLIGGKQATLSTLKKTHLEDYNYLHFATHGILGYEIPGITEPALVLSQENGANTFLTASEVKKLKLHADMTVLSACNTGSGQYSTGEGVMGIGQAFLSAGSKTVVMSLWPVPSNETVTLMGSFYAYINQGKTTTDALRLAKLDLIKGYQTSKGNTSRGLKRSKNQRMSKDAIIHPHYWAPFVIVGS